MNLSAKQLIMQLYYLLSPKLQCLMLRIFFWKRPSVGRGVYMHPSVQILGKAFVHIGDNTVIGQDGWLNVNHRHGDGFSIQVGNNCFIGRRNFFSSGKKIILGDFVLTANDCFFLGSSHVVSDPMVPYMITGTTENDEITIGHNTFIGAGVRIVGNVHVGHGCVIGAGSIILKDIPPFSQVYGSPAQVRRRYSFFHKKWVPLEDFTEKDEALIMDSDNYLKLLKKYPAPRMPYIASGGDMGHC